MRFKTSNHCWLRGHIALWPPALWCLHYRLERCFKSLLQGMKWWAIRALCGSVKNLRMNISTDPAAREFINLLCVHISAVEFIPLHFNKVLHRSYTIHPRAIKMTEGLVPRRSWEEVRSNKGAKIIMYHWTFVTLQK